MGLFWAIPVLQAASGTPDRHTHAGSHPGAGTHTPSQVLPTSLLAAWPSYSSLLGTGHHLTPSRHQDTTHTEGNTHTPRTPRQPGKARRWQDGTGRLHSLVALCRPPRIAVEDRDGKQTRLTFSRLTLGNRHDRRLWRGSPRGHGAAPLHGGPPTEPRLSSTFRSASNMVSI